MKARGVSRGPAGGATVLNTQILTPRLLLRPLQLSDRHAMHRMEQDPEVMLHLNGGLPTPLEPADPEASPYLMPRGGEPEVRAVVVREDGAIAGWVGLFVDGDIAEIGYRFFRSHWGRGYATEAGNAVIADAFERLGVARVTALTMALNTGSRRVLEKLGMQHTQTHVVEWSDPLPGAELGEVEYVLERQDWRP